ncbi:maleylacetoacetate isomerase [Vibrio sp. JPW-9-11-11]|uniref:maleylacetoacetate isomerase n=1 Tax=Vibrio sp. JPW-9-11-11 TaxID=1416532 RepID=UPI0015946BD7|nr:maleylacetoacetate isomerase [Vibrio sp. JPW-9-11-11]NVD06537.1 maleylacetoacetate isomerase [Vibrio sp. JPW-9-11-11]
MPNRVLYGYWRSSAAYRVRIALNLKGLEYQQRSVHLVKAGGEQHSSAFRQLNPNQLVPVFVDDEVTLNQSLTIIDYLDETYPEVLLTPSDKEQRYLVKALAQDIAIDIHPLNNLRVLQYLSNQLKVEDSEKTRWYLHWVECGFEALEQRLSQTHGQYCVGDHVTLADVCLVPQVYNARRFNLDMSRYPIIEKVTASLNRLDAFQVASPDSQPDTEH